jgi:hypothetical protein
VAADLDRDGALDVAMRVIPVPYAGNNPNLPHPSLIVFSGSGKGDFQQRKSYPLPHVLDTSGGRTIVPKHVFDVLDRSGLAVADMDGDKSPDVISWIGDDVVVFRTTPLQTSRVEVLFNPKEYTRIIGAADLDSDGIGDLLANVDGTIVYTSYDFKNGDDPIVRKTGKIDSFTIKQRAIVQVGDLDGDGHHDDLVIENPGMLSIAINDTDRGGGFALRQLGKPKYEDIRIGDVNGDGLDDLFTLRSINDTRKSILSIIR